MVVVRKHLSSLTGLAPNQHQQPSHKWLGYFHGRRHTPLPTWITNLASRRT